MINRGNIHYWILLVGMLILLFTFTAVRDAGASCHSKVCWHRVHKERVWDLCVKRHGSRFCVNRKRFYALPRSWREYAAAVFACEKGDQPGDHSSFIYRAEWSPSTARSAGLVYGYPSWFEEANAVVRWTKKVGFHTTAGWPNCP